MTLPVLIGYECFEILVCTICLEKEIFKMQPLLTIYKPSIFSAVLFSLVSGVCAQAEPLEVLIQEKSVQTEQSTDSTDAAPFTENKSNEDESKNLKADKKHLKLTHKHSRPDTGAHPYHARIEQHAANNNVPFFLANSMVRIESRYNPNARSGPNLGLGQISLSTAKSLGYSGSAQGLMDAETNLTYSIKYLAQAYKLASGDTCGTVARYQNGLRSTRVSAANRAYCAKVSKI